ncbi:thioredoxin-like [Glandiceps talaboti]
MSVREIETKEEFDAALKQAGDKLVVVDFSAEWCGPCRQIAPKYKAMAAEFKDVVFLKVDVDVNSDTSEACGVNCMPTFQFFKNSEKVEEFSGANEDKLRSTLKEKGGK